MTAEKLALLFEEFDDRKECINMKLFRSLSGDDYQDLPAGMAENAEEEGPAMPEKPPVPRSIGRETVLAQGQSFEGNLTGEGAVRLEGAFRGDISLRGVVSISMSGSLVGTIEATNVFISGTVEGDIIAHGKLRMSTGSKITGDIQSQILAIDDGASFNGRSTMLSGEAAPLPSPGAALPPVEELQFGRNYTVEEQEEDGEAGEAPQTGD